ncbi:hypothetical protein KGQ71_04160, partial [Patescibacteria group bacterium]|nr:hypothetical protein [Patescibacteria group bacterium]
MTLEELSEFIRREDGRLRDKYNELIAKHLFLSAQIRFRLQPIQDSSPYIRYASSSFTGFAR